MPENGGGFSGAGSTSGSSPSADKALATDPTALTTDALRREIAGLRELMETRIDALSDKHDARLQALSNLMDEADLRYQQRFDAQEKSLAAALKATQDASAQALEASNRAVLKAEGANEKRFEVLSEFREQLAEFMPRGEYSVQHASLDEKVNIVSARVNENANRILSVEQQKIGSTEAKQTMSDSVKLGLALIGSVVLLIGFFVAQRAG
jgi:hypothetical protein